MFDIEDITENVTERNNIKVYSVIHNMEVFTVEHEGDIYTVYDAETRPLEDEEELEAQLIEAVKRFENE